MTFLGLYKISGPKNRYFRFNFRIKSIMGPHVGWVFFLVDQDLNQGLVPGLLGQISGIRVRSPRIFFFLKSG